LRAESVTDEGRKKVPLAQRRVGFGDFDSKKTEARAKEVQALWIELAKHGAVLRFIEDYPEGAVMMSDVALS
jgi:DNA mismatch repair protein MutH